MTHCFIQFQNSLIILLIIFPNQFSDSKKCQQAAYRHELDKQIEEKRKLRQAEKENEKRNCEICSHQDMERRQNLMKDIERKFCERIRSKNVCIVIPENSLLNGVFI